MNKIIISIILLVSVNLFSQNKKIVYNFNEIPQVLITNPGADVDFKWHVGFPGLASNYIHAGASGFSAYDLLADDGVNFNTKLKKLIYNLDFKDFYTINQQTDVFNLGIQLKNESKDYVSFGFYEELDAILYHPKDYILLAYEGNSNASNRINFDNLNFKSELLGVFHIGINRKIDKKLTVGARLKIYSSVYNVTSTSNSGIFYTSEGENNFYKYSMLNMDMKVQTSGIVHNEHGVADENVVNRFFASGNMGLGLDFGFTYKINNDWVSAASFQDLGFIRHSKNTTVYSVQGNQEFEGLELEFPDSSNPYDYLQQFKDELPLETDSSSYTSYRTIKLNGSLGYQFGKLDTSDCLRSTYDTKRNEIGIQLYSALRPKAPQVAGTLYLYKKIAKAFRIKATYTVDSYSAKNIGFGFSSHIGFLNIYGGVDNILGYTDLAKSKNQTINFGINFTR